MTYQELRHNPEVLACLERGNHDLQVLGYTDHSLEHACLVADRAAYILRRLGCDDRTEELGRMAGLLHDIGNCINRKNHAEYGAILAGQILKEGGMPLADRMVILSAIGNHDESTGGAMDAVSAALILADKTDVRRSRVKQAPEAFDIHDRVNFAVTDTSLKVDPEEKKISLNLQVDENICTMYEYFDIFLGRMLLCRKAAEMLGARFRLTVNGGKVL